MKIMIIGAGCPGARAEAILQKGGEGVIIVDKKENDTPNLADYFVQQHQDLLKTLKREEPSEQEKAYKKTRGHR